MTITASQGTATYDVDEQPHLLPTTSIRRTRMTSLEHDWLSDVVSGWDAVFNDDSTTATRALAAAGRVNACVWGDGPTSFARLVREPLVLDVVAATAMSWNIVFHDDSPRLTDAALIPELPAADIITAVDTVTRTLGIAERDVLAAAGIRDRTFYHWKRNPSVTPRSGSQANLWAVVSSVAGIRAQLDDLAPSWLRSDPHRLKLFLSGQHARLALLAAAATEDVRVPSDTLDAHGGVEESADPNQLKRFRTRHSVELTHDEDGAPLARATNLNARFYADEPEDELIMIDVDD